MTTWQGTSLTACKARVSRAARLLRVIALVTGILSVHRGAAADWPMYRGNPGRTAVSPETGLLQEWPEEGPPLAWKLEGIGGDRSSPVVAGGVVYTRGDHGGVLAADAATGEVRWRAKARHADASPTVVDDRIVINAGAGAYYCLSTNDGAVLWSFNMTSVSPECLKQWSNKYGIYSQSPLVVSNTVIVEVGDPEVPVVGVSLEDGSLLWKATPGEEKLAHNRSYASPVFWQRGETPLVISHFGTAVAGLDARDGRVLWERKVNTFFGRGGLPLGNCAQVCDDLLINVSSMLYGGPITQSAYVVSSNGLSLTPAWHNPVLMPHQEGFLVYKGLAYGTGSATWTMVMNQEGLLIDGKPYSAYADTVTPPGSQSKRDGLGFMLPAKKKNKAPLLCIDARTGTLRGMTFDIPHGGGGGCTSHLLLAADNRIIATGSSRPHPVHLLEPGPAMTIISSFMPVDPTPPEEGTGKKRRRAGCWSSPALSNGLLFLRREDILLAYDLRDKSGT